MTEKDVADLESAMKDLTKSVTEHKYELGVKIAVLTTNVGTLQSAHDANTVKLDKVLALELECPARAGVGGVNARLKQLEVGEKLRIESELERARDEVTGQQDVMQRRIGERNYSETPSGRFFKMVAPYLWKGALIFGIAVGGTVVARCTGEDPVVTANALRAVTDLVTKTAADVEEVKVKVDEVVADTDQTAEAEPGVPMATLPAPILP